jgi:SAM-dependent methyltransferase
VRYFDGPGGAEYAEPPLNAMVRNTIEMVRTEGDGPRRALDVGCGPGQHALLLRDAGFEVALADGSLQMLSLAHQALGRPAPAPGDVRRLERLLDHYGEGEFDLVFACAVLIHVPRSEVPAILDAFHLLLRPGGALFVNFRIGDHTLVGVGNRFFAYYRDHQVLWKMLEEAGFYVRDLTTRRTGRTLSRGPRTIEWANFICTRERDL